MQELLLKYECLCHYILYCLCYFPFSMYHICVLKLVHSDFVLLYALFMDINYKLCGIWDFELDFETITQHK
jgi:hypothetical protein